MVNPVRPRNSPRRLRPLAVACSGALLAACAVGPDYRSPQMRMPAAFDTPPARATAAAAPPPAADPGKWWQAFGDPVLTRLVEKAIAANPQLEIALARVQEAREQEAVVLGVALPEVAVSGGAARGTGSDLARGRADQSLISAENGAGYSHVTQIYGFAAGWELDVFGRYRRELEAAQYDEQAARAARSNVLISIVADVVRAYVDLRGLQMQLAVLQKNVEVAQQYLDFVQQRYAMGITNGLDVTLAQRQLASQLAELAPMRAGIDAARYVIATLCGDFPENADPALAAAGTLPQLPEKLDPVVPLDLLRRRPDIIEAERMLAGATARVGVATASLYPRFTLTGSAGYQVQALGVTPSERGFIWSLGPAAGLPLLDFGTLDALVNIADLNTHALLMNYKQTVLGAVQDVDTAASAYLAQQDRLDKLRSALQASQESVSLATQRFDRGLIDSLNVIDAQRQQFQLEQQYVVAQQTAGEQFAALYKALGGGWEDYQSLPPIPRPLPAVIAALVRTVEPGATGRDMAAQGMAGK